MLVHPGMLTPATYGGEDHTRKAGAQTAQIAAANALIRPQPTPAQIGGDARVVPDLLRH